MKTLFIIALRNLIQAKERTLMLSLALSIVALLLTIMLALSQGVSNTMRESATTLVSGHVNVAGFYKAKVDDSFPLVTNVKEVEKTILNGLDGIDYTVIRQRGWGKIISATSRIQVSIHGVEIDNEPGLKKRLRLAPRSLYRENGDDTVVGDISQLSERNTVAIFAGQAKRLEVDVGDPLTLTTETLSGTVNTKDVRIVAIMKDVGFLSNWSIFADSQGLRELYQLNENTSGAIQIYLKDITQADQAMDKLRGKLSAAGYVLMEHNPNPFWQKFTIVQGENWTGQKVDLTTWENEVSFLKWAVTGLDAVSLSLIGILLIIIAIGIINTMLISVRERTREVGSLRAIGMHRRQVLLMFMFEALILGVLATALGACSGAALAAALNAAEITIPSSAVQAILLSDTLTLSVKASQIIQTITTGSKVFTVQVKVLKSVKLVSRIR